MIVTYTVARRFKDAKAFFSKGQKKAKIYEVGDDVSSFDEARLGDLVERGLVERSETPENQETSES